MPWPAAACRYSGNAIVSAGRKFVCADAVGMPSQLQLTEARVLLQLLWGCHCSCIMQMPWGYHRNCRPQLVYRFGGDAIIARPEFCSRCRGDAMAAAACRCGGDAIAATGPPLLCRCGRHAIDIPACLQWSTCPLEFLICPPEWTQKFA